MQISKNQRQVGSGNLKPNKYSNMRMNRYYHDRIPIKFSEQNNNTQQKSNENAPEGQRLTSSDLQIVSEGIQGTSMLTQSKSLNMQVDVKIVNKRMQ